MAGKIKVSKKIYDVLKYYENNHGVGWKSEMLFEVAKSRAGLKSNIEAITLDHNHSLLQLAEITVKGYEVESTPMDEVRYLLKQYSFPSDFNEGVQLGIVETLDSLGININDK